MKWERTLCKGYCDFRVDRLDDDMIDGYIANGYTCLALNTTIDGSVLGIGSSNKRKRKKGNPNLSQEDLDWVPAPPLKEHNEDKITILTRLTIKISSIGQLHRAMNSPNYNLYDIHAVEPLDNHTMQEAVCVANIDIITCNTTANITAKDYKNAVDKVIQFELVYAPMLSDSVARHEGLTIGHLLHIKGKSKNMIVSSGAVSLSQMRNVHDVMNICVLLGLSKEQLRYAVAYGCQAVILKTIGRRKGKSALTVTPTQQPQVTGI